MRKIEEKGSDVSLAAHMVSDALRGVADAYFLLSNDSDFVEALRIVRERSGSEIGLDVPTETSPAGALLDVRPSTCVRRTSARVSSRHDCTTASAGSACRVPGRRRSPAQTNGAPDRLATFSHPGLASTVASPSGSVNWNVTCTTLGGEPSFWGFVRLSVLTVLQLRSQ